MSGGTLGLALDVDSDYLTNNSSVDNKNDSPTLNDVSPTLDNTIEFDVTIQQSDEENYEDRSAQVSLNSSPFISNPNDKKYNLGVSTPTPLSKSITNNNKEDKRKSRLFRASEFNIESPEQNPFMKMKQYIEHNTTINDTHFNSEDDELDIDADSSNVLPKIAPTPWRKMRQSIPTAIAHSQPIRKYNPSINSYDQGFDLKSSKNMSGGMSATSSHEIENLQKEITSYKIQIKIFKEFIQELINKAGIKDDIELQNQIIDNFARENGNLPEEIIFFNKSDSKDIFSQADYEDLRSAHSKLEAINDELNARLASLENDFVNQESQLNCFLSHKQNWEDITNEILALLTEWASGSSKEAINRALQNTPLEVKLEVVKFELHKKLDHFNTLLEQSKKQARSSILSERRLSVNSFPLSPHRYEHQRNASSVSTLTSSNPQLPSPPQFIKAPSIDIDSTKILLNSLSQLQIQLNQQKEQTAHITNKLNQEIHMSKKIQNDYNRIYSMLEEKMKDCQGYQEILKDKNNKIKIFFDNIKELQQENLQISELKISNDKKQFNSNNADINAYLSEISNLKKQIELLKMNFNHENENLKMEVLNLQNTIKKNNGNHQSSQTDLVESNESLQKMNQSLMDKLKETEAKRDEMMDELLDTRKEINRLHQELSDLQKVIDLKQEESSGAIQSLTNQLISEQDLTKSLRFKLSQQESTGSFNSKDNYQAMEQLKKDLDMAVEKQRTLRAEKVRLSYNIQSLTNDKIALSANIRNLTDKVTSLTIGQQNKNNGMDESVLVKKLNILEYQFDELLNGDITRFKKLLGSFTKIADDHSLTDPKNKIEALMQGTGSNKTLDYNTIKEYHRSIFDYFSRAVDVIVHDHVKILLRDSQNKQEESQHILFLNGKIDELNKLNDHLAAKLKDQEANEINQNRNENNLSPRSMLRIDELNNRWKSEREARVYESEASNKRLTELEAENNKLREQLSKLSSVS